MSDLGPVEEAELITAAVGQFQERNPGAKVARVDLVDLADIEVRGLPCDHCGATITVFFFIKLCDACMDAARRM